MFDLWSVYRIIGCVPHIILKALTATFVPPSINHSTPMPSGAPSPAALRALRTRLYADGPCCSGSGCESSLSLSPRSLRRHQPSLRQAQQQVRLYSSAGSLATAATRSPCFYASDKLQPLCSLQPLRSLHPLRSLRSLRTTQTRLLSQLAPVTSVGAPRIPAAFQDLHGALKELEHSAINYANLSKLSLALRGLESDNATVRVAGEECPAAEGTKTLILAGQCRV